MKKPFSGMHPTKAHFIKCSSLLAIAVVIFIASFFNTRNELPDNAVLYTAEKSMNIYSKFNEDTILAKVRKGEKLRVYAYMPSENSHVHPSLWVENYKGVRGFIRAVDTNTPILGWNANNKTMEPVTILGFDDKEVYHKYICRFEDGTNERLKFDEIKPLFPDSLKRNILKNNSDIYISLNKFEKDFMGDTFDENEEKLRPALSVQIIGNNFRAKYPINVIDTKTGYRYKPIIIYDKEGNAVSYTLDDRSKRSAWLIRTLPGMSFIMDNFFATTITQSSMYDDFPAWMSEEVDAGNLRNTAIFIIGIIFIILGVIWIYLTPYIIPLLMGVLLHYPKVFYRINNLPLRIIILLTTLLSLYVWIGMMLMWGIIDFFLLIYLFRLPKMLIMIMDPIGIRCRCCRHLESKPFHDKVELGVSYVWKPYGKVISRSSKPVSKWHTWTNTKYKYSNGNTYSVDHDYKTHTVTTNTEVYEGYDIHFKVTEYTFIYKCPYCGLEETLPHTEYTEIDRRYTGEHTKSWTTEKTESGKL